MRLAKEIKTDNQAKEIKVRSTGDGQKTGEKLRCDKGREGGRERAKSGTVVGGWGGGGSF